MRIAFALWIKEIKCPFCVNCSGEESCPICMYDWLLMAVGGWHKGVITSNSAGQCKGPGVNRQESGPGLPRPAAWLAQLYYIIYNLWNGGNNSISLTTFFPRLNEVKNWEQCLAPFSSISGARQFRLMIKSRSLKSGEVRAVAFLCEKLDKLLNCPSSVSASVKCIQ